MCTIRDMEKSRFFNAYYVIVSQFVNIHTEFTIYLFYLIV